MRPSWVTEFLAAGGLIGVIISLDRIYKHAQMCVARIARSCTDPSLRILTKGAHPGVHAVGRAGAGALYLARLRKKIGATVRC